MLIILFTTLNIAQNSNEINIITVKKNANDGVKYDYTGNRAIQDAIEGITDASENNKYQIVIYPGTYEATSTNEFNAKGSPWGYSFIVGRDYISIKGTNRDSVIINGELPSNLGSNFSYASYQTVYWNANEATLENVTITARNLRYPIHLDGGQTGMANAKTKFSNLIITHYGNKDDATNWKSETSLGLGMSDGQVLEVENSILESNSKWALYMHSNKNFKQKSKLVFRNCKFITRVNDNIIGIFQSLASKKNDEVMLQNCSWENGYIINANDWPYLATELDEQSYNHCDLKIKGFGNSSVLWDSSFRGEVLKITSKSSNGKVRFDEESSAFKLIIKGEKSDTEILYGGQNTAQGYTYRDGNNEINGYAIGRVDVGEESTYDKKFIKSLGKRLGDCSEQNKTLGIIVDNKYYQIVLNKNYVGEGENNILRPSEYSNSKIIEEIENVIGDVANVLLEAVGNNYYPEFSDCLNIMRASENILNGMIVFKEESGLIRKAKKEDTEIYGIAIDDIITNSVGRVLTRGYLSTLQYKRFKVLVDNNSIINAGESVGIGATPGIGSRESENKVFFAKDNNVIAIGSNPIISVNKSSQTINGYLLEQNFPNPFNPNTTIGFSLPKEVNVELVVFNSIGEEVSNLVNGNMDAGHHKINFDGSGFSSGLYLYKITASNFVDAKKMILIK